MADVKLFVFIREFFDNLEGVEAAIGGGNCPKVVAACDAFAALPSIQEYLAQRKETPF